MKKEIQLVSYKTESLYPLGIRFKISDKHPCQAFYMGAPRGDESCH